MCADFACILSSCVQVTGVCVLYLYYCYLPAAAANTPLGGMPTSLPNLPIASSYQTPTTTSVAGGSSNCNTVGSAPSLDPALAWLLQSMAAGTSRLPTASERVLIGQGIPTIPKQLLHKIRNWEYIDLAELLPAASTPPTDVAPARFSLFPGCEVVRQKKRQITSIADWVQAFAVYMAAIVSEHPSATLELLAYMLTIIKASQQYDGLYWRSYDTNYRITAAASGNRQWSKLDTDLYTRFFTGRAKPIASCSVCDSTSHQATDCPHDLSGRKFANRKRDAGKYPLGSTPAAKRKQWPSEVCAEYNARGACAFGSRCKFKHVCGDCSGDHPAKACSAKL